MPRGVLSAVLVLVLVTLSTDATATFSPAPIRLALLFDRPVWASDSGSIVMPAWHVVERLER